MATKIFRADSPTIVDVWTFTPGGTIEASDVWNTISNGKTVAATNIGGTTVALACTAIYDAVVASTNGEFTAMTWADNTTTVTATGPSDGTPSTFTVTTTETGGGASDGQTYVATNTTAASSPNDWNVAANWSASGVPGADIVWLKDTAVNIKWGFAQSAVTLAELNSEASFTGDLGLPATNESGGYFEYRATYMAISATAWNHGRGEGPGSRRFQINTGTNVCTSHIWRTGSRIDQGVPPCLWRGVHASNAMTVHRGDVGIAHLPGEVATLPTLTVGYVDNLNSDSTVSIGSGATLTTINQGGGRVTSFASATITTYNLDNGTYYAYGGAVTTLAIDGGTAVWMGTGTITTLTINTDGEFDADQSDGNFVVVNTIVMKAGSTLRNLKGRINNGVPLRVRLDGCGLKDVTIENADNLDISFGPQGLFGNLALGGQIVAGFVPLDMQTQRDADWVNLTNYAHLSVLFFKGTGTNGDDPTITLQQASDNTGTGVKALNFTTIYRKQAADVQTVASFTTTTQASSNTYTNTDAHEQLIWVLEVERSDLDIAGGFTYARVTFNDTGINAQLGCTLYVLTNPLSSSLPSAL